MSDPRVDDAINKLYLRFGSAMGQLRVLAEQAGAKFTEKDEAAFVEQAELVRQRCIDVVATFFMEEIAAQAAALSPKLDEKAQADLDAQTATRISELSAVKSISTDPAVDVPVDPVPVVTVKP